MSLAHCLYERLVPNLGFTPLVTIVVLDIFLKMKIYLYFLSLLKNETAQVVKIMSCRRQGPIQLAYSIPWLQRSRDARSLDYSGHQQSPYWLTLNVRGPSYLGLTGSISWLVMPWLLTSPGHQQQWYWLYRICRSWSYLRKDFKYLCHINVE